MYDRIKIERNRGGGFTVCCTDPAIVASNQAREDSRGDVVKGTTSKWRDPNVEYDFEEKSQVLAFVEKAMDIALPEDEYSSAFDKLAKQAKGKSNE